jgi:hypothetical protein
MARDAITLRKVPIRNPACVQPLKFKESRMGITLFSFGGLLAPLQSLIGWFAGGLRGTHRRAHTRATAAHATAPRSCVRRPLRVVRVLEACPATSGAGRMVISGRMADVCAELDRLAELEAAAG